jgi:alkylmercury lyase
MSKPKLKSIAPILNVNSRTMKPMIDFFTERLGFDIDTVLGKQPAFAMLKRDKQVVMLVCKPLIPWPHKGWAAYIWVDDIEVLHADLQRRGAPIKTGPALKDYGCREIEVTTPDGREIVFGQVVSTTQRERMEINELAERLRDSGVPTHFEENQARLLAAVWRLVTTGQPVTGNQIREAILCLGGPVEEGMAFIAQVSEQDEHGNVAGIFGLSQRQHPHRFILDSRTFTTWCAWDALFLPPMLKRKARIESICPQTKCGITVALGPEGVESTTPAETVLSIVLPERDEKALDGVEQVWSFFCSHVHFFASEAVASEWFSGKDLNFELLRVEDGFRLGLETFREILQYT